MKILTSVYGDDEGNLHKGSPCESAFDVQELAEMVDGIDVCRSLFHLMA